MSADKTPEEEFKSKPSKSRSFEAYLKIRDILIYDDLNATDTKDFRWDIPID